MKTALARAGAFATLFVLLALPQFVGAQSKSAADLIIRNAKLWTVDKDHPTAQAVAVLGDRIVAVDSNEDVEAWRGARTRTVDASGKLLLPGFNDSHVHFVDGGLSLDSVQLNDATSAADIPDGLRRPGHLPTPSLRAIRIRAAQSQPRPNGCREPSQPLCEREIGIRNR